jgi:hypothetical protein
VIPGSDTPRADFWLGDRGEGKVTDFDGRVRACYVLGRLTVGRAEAGAYIWVRLDPALQLELSRRKATQVVLRPRRIGRDVEDLPTEPRPDDLSFLTVDIFEILDASGLASGVVPATAVRFERGGEIAGRPDLLPPTPEEKFRLGFRLLEKFVARHGHADVPHGHLEDGIGLGAWVGNMRFWQANLVDFPQEWTARLEGIRGWKWLPGSDFFLVDRYARREGHTRIPEDYIEEARPLGSWVADLRRSHASGRLSPSWSERLEGIPGWEW